MEAKTIWFNAYNSMAYLFAVYVTGVGKTGDFPEYVEDELAGYLCDIESMLAGDGRETVREVRKIAKQQLDNIMVPYHISAKTVKNNIIELADQFDPEIAIDWYSKIADEIEMEMDARKGE